MMHHFIWNKSWGLPHGMRIEGLDTGRNKIMLLELCNIRDWAHSWAQHPHPRRFISKRPWHKHTCHGASYFWTPLLYAIYTQLGLDVPCYWQEKWPRQNDFCHHFCTDVGQPASLLPLWLHRGIERRPGLQNRPELQLAKPSQGVLWGEWTSHSKIATTLCWRRLAMVGDADKQGPWWRQTPPCPGPPATLPCSWQKELRDSTVAETGLLESDIRRSGSHLHNELASPFWASGLSSMKLWQWCPLLKLDVRIKCSNPNHWGHRRYSINDGPCCGIYYLLWFLEMEVLKAQNVAGTPSPSIWIERREKWSFYGRISRPDYHHAWGTVIRQLSGLWQNT